MSAVTLVPGPFQRFFHFDNLDCYFFDQDFYLARFLIEMLNFVSFGAQKRFDRLHFFVQFFYLFALALKLCQLGA